MYIALESIKTLAWTVILIIVLVKRNQLTLNVYWLSLISAALMIVAGIQDILNYSHLPDKSVWWFIANIFILANYFIIIKGCCKFFHQNQMKLDDFIKKVEKDKQELL